MAQEEPFHYLVEQLITIEDVLGWQSDTIDLAPCEHYEANVRLILHAVDAAKRAFNKATVNTVDTDVVVTAVAAF